MKPVLILLIALGIIGGPGLESSTALAQESTRGGEFSASASAAPNGISQAIERHRNTLLKIPGVVAVKRGWGVNSNEIVVVVKEVTPKLERRIPKQLDGWPVEFEVTEGSTAYGGNMPRPGTEATKPHPN
jgi:hypothetical protein